MKERRKSPRYQVVLKARYETREEFENAILNSLSPSGLYLAIETPFDVGHQFALEIDLPEEEGWIKGMCEVVWVNQIDAENYPKGMGVKFIEMADEYRKRLEEYINNTTKM
jgi:uncharacterized protein (TIGR02266 family)